MFIFMLYNPLIFLFCSQREVFFYLRNSQFLRNIKKKIKSIKYIVSKLGSNAFNCQNNMRSISLFHVHAWVRNLHAMSYPGLVICPWTVAWKTKAGNWAVHFVQPIELFEPVWQRPGRRGEKPESYLRSTGCWYCFPPTFFLYCSKKKSATLLANLFQY